EVQPSHWLKRNGRSVARAEFDAVEKSDDCHPSQLGLSRTRTLAAAAGAGRGKCCRTEGGSAGTQRLRLPHHPISERRHLAIALGPSYWHSSLEPGDTLTPRAQLPGDVQADVAVVGAGFAGLWTAYYLLKADPARHVVVLEAETA